MKIYDITAAISENLPIFGGGKRPEIKDLLELEKGDACNFSAVTLTTHTGTHIDTPLHFIKGGDGNDTISLDHFYGKAKVFTIKTDKHITADDLKPLDIEEGDIVLINTGQSKYMSAGEFKEDFIAFTKEAAEYLVSKKIKTIGIDYLSIDPYNEPGYPAHMTLLGNNIAAIEGVVLTDVPDGEYILSALPLKFPKGNGSPVRAVLIKMC